MLGQDFQTEVRRAEALIADRPATWPRWSGVGVDVRRFRLTRFPYCLEFQVTGASPASAPRAPTAKPRPVPPPALRDVAQPRSDDGPALGQVDPLGQLKHLSSPSAALANHLEKVRLASLCKAYRTIRLHKNSCATYALHKRRTSSAQGVRQRETKVVTPSGLELLEAHSEKTQARRGLALVF